MCKLSEDGKMQNMSSPSALILLDGKLFCQPVNEYVIKINTLFPCAFETVRSQVKSHLFPSIITGIGSVDTSSISCKIAEYVFIIYLNILNKDNVVPRYS